MKANKFEASSANQSGVSVALWASVCFCVTQGYVCGDRNVTLLCDVFGGHSTTVMDGFADACPAHDAHQRALRFTASHGPRAISPPKGETRTKQILTCQGSTADNVRVKCREGIMADAK